MHSVSKTRIIILIISLISTSSFLYLQPVPSIKNRSQNLNQALANIPGWQNSNPYTIDVSIVEALKLDDYFNQSFYKKEEMVSLYIGFYNSSKKVGAAHDPMVCFPGQGWVLSNKRRGEIELTSDLSVAITYSTMIATKGDDQQLILYWFQAYDTTCSNTFSQKINLIWKRFFNKGEDNAFVRIIVPLNKQSMGERKSPLFDFINSFYPIFLNYIIND